MKTLFLISSFLFVLLQTIGEKPNVQQTEFSIKTDTPMKSSFYDFKMKDLNGNEVDFASFKGKKILVVNVASKCGYTPQYEGLQKLHEEYGE